jgi:hypothetical protein
MRSKGSSELGDACLDGLGVMRVWRYTMYKWLYSLPGRKWEICTTRGARSRRLLKERGVPKAASACMSYDHRLFGKGIPVPPSERLLHPIPYYHTWPSSSHPHTSRTRVIDPSIPAIPTSIAPGPPHFPRADLPSGQHPSPPAAYTPDSLGTMGVLPGLYRASFSLLLRRRRCWCWYCWMCRSACRARAWTMLYRT